MKQLFYKIYPQFNGIETREQFVIRWADTLIEQSTVKGVLDRYCFAIPWSGEGDTTNKIRHFRAKVFKDIKASVTQLDHFTSSFTKYYGEVEGFLLNQGYMEKPAPSFDWILTPIGKEVKEWGGHQKYREHKERERRALRSEQNEKIYWYLREAIKWAILFGLGYVAGLLTGK